MSRITFKEATDLLFENMSYATGQLAELLGLHTSSIIRARRTDRHGGRPPEGWETTVARAAREHAEMLRTHAARLDALASELDRAAEDT